MSEIQLSARGTWDAAPRAEPFNGSDAAAGRVAAAYERIAGVDRPDVWITLRPAAEALAEAELVDAAVARGEHLPLAGTVVAVKDNVDVAGLPTTAACPEYSYLPAATAPSVARLVEAGALVLGKANLDQFATGLVGTRSPYGVVASAWSPDHVGGGSSSGSALAVALGIADLGVGTDTAGSGRIPAAFNGIVGLKPTLRLVSTEGVVPASRSFDCVSVFASTVAAAEQAAQIMAGPAPERAWPADAPLAAPADVRIAIPDAPLPHLTDAWAAQFAKLVARLAESGARIVHIPVEAFLEGASLLYGTALVAERYAAYGDFAETHPYAMDPSVGSIVGAAAGFRASELVAAFEQLDQARRRALAALADADVLLLPTAPEQPTIADVAADPLGVNRRLGSYASFANPFDLAAVAAPAGDLGGAPFGVTVFARPFGDHLAADVARRVAREPAPPVPEAGTGVPLLAIGAHLTGQPLNGELTSRGARFAGARRTEAVYRLFALSTVPPKPGLQHVGPAGYAIEGELWLLPRAGLGSLLASLPEPMTLGRVRLDDGSEVTGFFCQASATVGADDISALGGWRRHLEQRR